MTNTDKHLQNVNKQICENIDRIRPDDRDFYASNILKLLRDFVETIIVKLSGSDEYGQPIFKSVQNNIFSKGQYKFLRQFHGLLNRYNSHNTEIGDNATRLVIKYKEYLLEIKKLFKKRYKIDILENISNFPIKENKDLQEYYEKVSQKIEARYSNSFYNNTYYYIERIKPFFIGENIYYEVGFRTANDYYSKFDKLIAFTKIKILPNYAVKLKFREDKIDLFGKKVSIKMIDDYEVSIRPCELKNFGKVLNINENITRTNEYKNIMLFLRKYYLNLLDLVLLSEDKYKEFKNVIISDKNIKVSSVKILNILDAARGIIVNKKSGANILKYLLYIMNNVVIRNQFSENGNKTLSELKLQNGCMQFDRTPFSFFPLKHTPRFQDLWESIGVKDKKSDLFARLIKNNTETKGQLYTDINSANNFGDIDTLIYEYNDMLWSGFKADSSLSQNAKQVYIQGYENKVIEIIKHIDKLSNSGILGYKESVEAWLKNNPTIIDDDVKKKSLLKMFVDSRVSLVYGSAGTGKTKLIEHIANYSSARTKLLLANTHTAKNNLERRVGVFANSIFGTVKSYTYKDNIEVDLLIIDECSTVSNDDMLKLLEKIDFKFLVLVGDIYQIESIRFGNWFYLLQNFFPNIAIELQETRRTDDESLLKFWHSVRNLEDNITNLIVPYAQDLDETIFNKIEEEEIILCLNYDGLYGINNINKLLQLNNANPIVKWGEHIYKVGDPILFNEIRREGFGNIIYNNLKGVINNIDKEINEKGEEKRIVFDVEIEESLTEFDVINTCIELVGVAKDKSIIRFYINRIQSQDEDSNDLKDDIVPFQIAYAVSIHKAQGLEYDSVKIVITDEIDEQITHNIFYTAITRARKNLKIYWSPETQQKIINNMIHKFNKKDFNLLKNKINISSS